MNRLVFVTRNMKAGGAERVIAQLANYFHIQGLYVSIITLDYHDLFYEINKSIKLYSIGNQSKNRIIDKLLRYYKVRKHIVNESPDLVLAMPEEIGIFVIPALLGTKLPVFVSERNNPWLMPWKKTTRFMRRLFYPLAAGLIFQTKAASTFFSKKLQEKAIVLPNPLDLSRVPEPHTGKRRKEVVSAGRLEKQKNFSLLIRAFAQFYKVHPDYVLTIYGEGSLKKELVDLATTLLPEHSFSFPGNTPRLLEKMNGASMFVLSSNYEGMPNVLIEAMAMGIPVISTDCPPGGPRELIKNGHNGILVSTDNVNELWQSMLKIAESDELSFDLGMNALGIKDELDSNKVCQQWKEYLDEIILK